MSQLLTLSRAARLVGTTRGALQQKIKDGALSTFEGMISVEELLRVYPRARLEDDRAIERLTLIKEAAFAKRVRERILPDPEVMVTRIGELARELADARRQLARQRGALDGLEAAFSTLAERGGEAEEIVRALRAALREALAATGLADDVQSLVAMDQVLGLMSVQVQLHPSGHEFFVNGPDTILEAALAAGLSLNYGCSSGNCGLCKARIVSGDVRKVRPHDYVLTEAEKLSGHVLLCSNTAVTDLVIEAAEALGARDIPLQHIAARVRRTEPLSGDIMLLHLQTPRTNRLRFLAGQSATLTLADGTSAGAPIASCPCDDRNIQFHIRHSEGDAFAEQVFTRLRAGDGVVIDGPSGEFVLNEDTARPLLLIACDTGFAPIKSLAEHAMALDHAESLHLYWLTAHARGPYLGNVCRAWSDAFDNFRYSPLPVAMGADGQAAADALAGAAQRIAMDREDLAGCDVYIAGPAGSVEVLARELLARGVPPQQLRAAAA